MFKNFRKAYQKDTKIFINVFFSAYKLKKNQILYLKRYFKIKFFPKKKKKIQKKINHLLHKFKFFTKALKSIFFQKP